MGILNKAMIEKWILPHLTVGTRGFDTTVPLTQIVECIFHRLKTARCAGPMSMAGIAHQTVLYRQNLALEFSFLLLQQVE